MPSSQPYADYRAMSISTLTPGELIVRLYDELGLNISRAIRHIEAGKPAEAHVAIMKAENIVLYFIDILDMNYPIADRLLALYEFIYRRLMQANAEKSSALLEECRSFALDLKNTWKQAEDGLHIQSGTGGRK